MIVTSWRGKLAPLMSDDEIIRGAFRNRGEANRGGAYVLGACALVVLGAMVWFGPAGELIVAALVLGGCGVALFATGTRMNRRRSPILELLLEEPTKIVRIRAESGEMGTLLSIHAIGTSERITVMGADQPLLDALRRRCPAAELDDLRG